jgi:hypothetical protein
MHEMAPPYPDLDGAKIRVITKDGSLVGDLITAQQKQERKFGARIDIVQPAVYYPQTSPIPLGQWVDIGYLPVTVLPLSKEQIERIKKVVASKAGDPAFELTL